MKAVLKNHRQSTRKTKLVADLVRGKSLAQVRNVLRFTDKKAAPVFLKLINSAAANARSSGAREEDLFVKEITVNQGIALRRVMPQARGSAHAIKRGASHISVVLGTKTASAPAKHAATKVSAEKKVAKKVVKKTA